MYTIILKIAKCESEAEGQKHCKIVNEDRFDNIHNIEYSSAHVCKY